MSTEKPNIGIDDKNREQIIESLNKLLADEFVLYTKTRNYHWNVTGPHFNDLHKFFEEQYTQLAEIVDEVAETTRQLGGIASGTLAEFLKQSRLQEHPGEVPEDQTMLQNLVEDHEAIIRTLRHDAERADEMDAIEIADFLTGLIEQHSKIAWMTRSMASGRRSEAKGGSKHSLSSNRK